MAAKRRERETKQNKYLEMVVAEERLSHGELRLSQKLKYAAGRRARILVVIVQRGRGADRSRCRLNVSRALAMATTSIYLPDLGSSTLQICFPFLCPLVTVLSVSAPITRRSPSPISDTPQSRSSGHHYLPARALSLLLVPLPLSPDPELITHRRQGQPRAHERQLISFS